MLRFTPLRPGHPARCAKRALARASQRWTLRLGAALMVACASSNDSTPGGSKNDQEQDQEQEREQDNNPALAAGTCEGGSTEPCTKFVTPEGMELELGTYGAVMEPNVGAAFANPVDTLLDNEFACSLFVATFAADPEQSARLLDIMDLDLSLYSVYRPANWVAGEKYPVVTWGNGTCAQPEGYGALLRYVASQGFFVIAANSRYVGSGEAQRRALDFAFQANEDSKSPYYRKLDTSRVAAMGHSQGGMGTVAAAADPRIKAVILFNGGESAAKPFLAISGDRDIFTTGSGSLASSVSAAPKAAFLFYHMIPGNGTFDGHLTLMLQPERVTGPTVAWLKYALDGDAESKGWFVGSSCELCGHDEDYEFGQNGLD